MRSTKNYWLLMGFLTVIGFFSCKKWDDHIAANEQNLNENLMEHISQQSNLSTFKDYLVKTGLDKVIGSSKSFTVFAPTNEALQSLSANVVNDTAQLKAFLLNHISGQLYFTRMAADSVRVPMLNGKRVFFYQKHFDDATITQPDVYVRNGVLQVIDKSVAPLPSVWEYMESTKNTYEQNAYVTSLVYTKQDPSKAELDSINPATGEPVYKPNTGIVQINSFRTKVYDLADEDSLYTYILLTNNAYHSETDKQKPYFNSSDAAITNSNASWNVVKDLAIKGLYLPGQLPGVLVSKSNVHVPMNQAAIVETHKVSNGIVYVMNAAAAPIEEKIPVSIIQGENPFGFSSILDKYMTKVFIRNRSNPLTSQSFKDLYMNLGSSGANYYVDYLANNLYTTKYKVYWVALNDKTQSGQGDDTYGTDSTMHQILQIGSVSEPFAPGFNVNAAVEPYQYNEVYLGEYTNNSHDWYLASPQTSDSAQVITPATRRLRLQAPASVVSGVPYNLTLDYIKLVPVF